MDVAHLVEKESEESERTNARPAGRNDGRHLESSKEREDVFAGTHTCSIIVLEEPPLLRCSTVAAGIRDTLLHGKDRRVWMAEETSWSVDKFATASGSVTGIDHHVYKIVPERGSLITGATVIGFEIAHLSWYRDPVERSHRILGRVSTMDHFFGIVFSVLYPSRWNRTTVGSSDLITSTELKTKGGGTTILWSVPLHNRDAHVSLGRTDDTRL